MKTPKCPICGGPHYKSFCWKNPKRGYNLKKKYEKAYKTGKVGRMEKTLSKETTQRKRLIMELDKYCSLVVRLEAANKYGILSCYTCGKRIPWKQAQNCHFKSRQYLGTRFDWDNQKAGCSECNVAKHGNLAKYREHLLKDIGEDRVNDLERKKLIKPTTPELEELLKEAKLKYKNLLEEKRKEVYN